MALQQLLYSRKAVLVDRAVPEGLYIVKTGSVRVQEVTSGAVPQSRHAGQCFAEHALFSRSAQTTLEVRFNFGFYYFYFDFSL